MHTYGKHSMLASNAKEKNNRGKGIRSVCVLQLLYLLFTCFLFLPLNCKLYNAHVCYSQSQTQCLTHSGHLIHRCCSMSKGTPPSLWPGFQEAKREIPREREESNSLSALGKRLALRAVGCGAGVQDPVTLMLRGGGR